MKEIAQVLAKNSLEAAPLLLGCVISRKTGKGLIRVKIVETEAYHQDDPASHSFAGLTKRTAPMFEAGGRLYVYFTYGTHYCINIVTGPEGVGEAVLLRAAEPIEGIEIMRKNRGVNDIAKLTNGPGKLAQAFGITDTKLSGKRLGPDTIFLEFAENPTEKVEILTSARIGIRKAIDNPWRFYIKGNPFVSRKII